MGKERVDERAVGRAGRGMDDKARRLVDDDQVAVLPHHRKRHVLRHRLKRDGRVEPEVIDLPLAHGRLGVGHRQAVAADGALGQHPGDPGARQIRIGWHIPRQCLIEPVRGICADHHL